MNKDELAEKAFEEMSEIGAVEQILMRMRERPDNTRTRGLIRTMLDIRGSMNLQFCDEPTIEHAFGMFGSQRRKLIVFFTHLELDPVEIKKAADRERGDYRFFMIRETEERQSRISRLIEKLEQERSEELK